MSGESKKIPRKLWIYWHQGLAEAPFVVNKCCESWTRENPDWEVTILDKNSFSNYIRLDLPEEIISGLPLSKISNLIRLQLLSEYGGVWADATTYCMKPLNEWIDDYCPSGFFVFSRPGPDRLISSWFIAGEKDCPIFARLLSKHISFFRENKFNNEGKTNRKILKRLNNLLNRSDKTTRFWFSPVVTKLIRVYPYFLFHYLFERLVAKDRECRKIWQEMKKVSADGPHKIQILGIFSPLNDEIKAEIDNKRTPLYKLTWKYDHSKYTSASILYYLLEGRDSENFEPDDTTLR